jgi:hypothetical protein
MSKLKPPRAEQVQKNGGSMYPVLALQAALSPRSGAGKQASERETHLKATVEKLQKSGILRVQGPAKVAAVGAALRGGKMVLDGVKAVGPRISSILGGSGAASSAAASAASKAAPAAAAGSQAATAANAGGGVRGLWNRLPTEAMGRTLSGATLGVGADTIAGMVDADTGGMGMLAGGLAGAIGGRGGSQLMRRLLPAAYDRKVISGGQRLGGWLNKAKPTLNTAGYLGVLGDLQSRRSGGAINVARPFDMLRNSQSRLVELAESPEAAEFLTSKITDRLRDKLTPSGDTIQRLLASLGYGARYTREGFARGYNGGERYIFE